MKRYTWLTLLAGAAIASIGYAGLRRGAWRTAFRYRLIDRTLTNNPAPAPSRTAPLQLVEEEERWALDAERAA